VEGFLKGSGLLLIHSEGIWEVLDSWVTTLSTDAFLAILPLLRRTFAEFTPSERQQMGERVAQEPSSKVAIVVTNDFDVERAQAALPAIALLLGL
jgi:hypothetical protein